MVKIRPSVSPHDVAEVRKLFLEYQAALGVDLCFQGFERELATLPGAYAPPSGALLLAERAGEVVGCVGLRPLDPPSVAEMKRLYVRPTDRGGGGGRALALAILECARRAGYERVRLDTLPSMREAQALYHALGFVAVPPYRQNPVSGAVFMELTFPSGSTLP